MIGNEGGASKEEEMSDFDQRIDLLWNVDIPKKRWFRHIDWSLVCLIAITLLSAVGAIGVLMK